MLSPKNELCKVLVPFDLNFRTAEHRHNIFLINFLSIFVGKTGELHDGERGVPCCEIF